MVRGWHFSPRRESSGGGGAHKLAAGLIGLTSVAALLAATAPAEAGTALVAVGSPAPVPSGAVRLGSVPASATLRIDVALAPRDPAALTGYATQVATPGSALYHHYLARGAFAARFGATRSAIASVTSALRSLGLRPGTVSSSHLSIPVTATAGQVEQAFATTLARYRLPGGRTGFANTRAPVLPASAAAHVQAVVGLDNLVRQQQLMTRPARTPARRARAAQGARPAISAGEPTGGPQPCAQAVTETNWPPAPGDFYGFTADELAYAYKFSPLYQAGDFGQGVTVGIVEFGEPNLSSDVAAYQSCYGTHASVTYYSVDGYNKTGPGEGEAALDIETVIGLAPQAKISVFRGPNTATGAYDVYGSIIAQDKARVISVSYGLCEHYEPPSDASATNVLFEQAAAQGQSVVASSGDSGSEACVNNDGVKTRLSANFPASDPFVLSVGGTAIVNTLGPPPGELVWNDGYDSHGAGGGGKSTFFTMPGYQQSFLGVSGGVREVPDVSADADPESGYVVIYKGNYMIIGGTSAAAPLWAALLALTDASAQCTTPVGFANPVIYYAASPADPNNVMTDIIADPTNYPGNVSNDYTGSGGGHYPVLAGYDMATGLGSPIGGQLASDICGYSAEPHGYWLATASGHVYAFNAPGRGSVTGRLASPVVGIASDKSANGYWLVTAKGHVYAFGAPSHGSVTGRLASPVVGIAADQATGGYWLVTAKGHVYSFGAPSHGSPTHLTSPVVGIAADPFTTGYWIVTASGKVYAMDAGSYPGQRISSTVTGIAANPLKQGYWLVTATGRIYAFHVGSYGSMPVGGALGRVTAMAADAGGGYWLATATGHVAAFGGLWHGDHAGESSKNPIVGIAGTG